MTKRTIFQAGFVNGISNNWNSVGTGRTTEEAKQNLEKFVHRKALEYVANFVKTYPGHHYTPELLEKIYDEGVRFMKNGRYIEQSFEENVEVAV